MTNALHYGIEGTMKVKAINPSLWIFAGKGSETASPSRCSFSVTSDPSSLLNPADFFIKALLPVHRHHELAPLYVTYPTSIPPYFSDYLFRLPPSVLSPIHFFSSFDDPKCFPTFATSYLYLLIVNIVNGSYRSSVISLLIYSVLL
jgi:hypothetical protein